MIVAHEEEAPRRSHATGPMEDTAMTASAAKTVREPVGLELTFMGSREVAPKRAIPFDLFYGRFPAELFPDLALIEANFPHGNRLISVCLEATNLSPDEDWGIDIARGKFKPTTILTRAQARRALLRWENAKRKP